MTRVVLAGNLANGFCSHIDSSQCLRIVTCLSELNHLLVSNTTGKEFNVPKIEFGERMSHSLILRTLFYESQVSDLIVVQTFLGFTSFSFIQANWSRRLLPRGSQRERDHFGRNIALFNPYKHMLETCLHSTGKEFVVFNYDCILDGGRRRQLQNDVKCHLNVLSKNERGNKLHAIRLQHGERGFEKQSRLWKIHSGVLSVQAP
jgi:hypothetical protein